MLTQCTSRSMQDHVTTRILYWRACMTGAFTRILYSYTCWLTSLSFDVLGWILAHVDVSNSTSQYKSNFQSACGTCFLCCFTFTLNRNMFCIIQQETACLWSCHSVLWEQTNNLLGIFLFSSLSKNQWSRKWWWRTWVLPTYNFVTQMVIHICI